MVINDIEMTIKIEEKEKDGKKEYESEYGEEYTISSDFDFLFGKLNDSEYSYAFAFEEINGATSYTNLVEYEKN